VVAGCASSDGGGPDGAAGAGRTTLLAADQGGPSTPPAVSYQTAKIDGVDVFYREAGPRDAPAVLLLHGFPASSFMFRNLIPRLATRYHVIAPDYPGYGQSASPAHDRFEYTFDHLASVVDQLTRQLRLEKFTIYVQDYGAPVGYRLAAAHPERITGIVVQNGNAYVEGLPDGFWGPIKQYWADRSAASRARLEGVLTPDGYKGQYLTGVTRASEISPDTWTLDAANLARPGNKDVQLDLLLDYGSNPPLYPKWQEYFYAPAADADRLGQERRDLPARRCRAVQAGLEEPRIPPARHRALRAGGVRRRDRRADAPVPGPQRGAGRGGEVGWYAPTPKDDAP
jgi:pimeloyl-ACP methyl ester carboxylesterase